MTGLVVPYACTTSDVPRGCQRPNKALPVEQP